jgi:hypothetical protein
VGLQAAVFARIQKEIGSSEKECISIKTENVCFMQEEDSYQASRRKPKEEPITSQE